MVVKANFPHEALLLAGALEVLLGSLVRYLVIMLVLVWLEVELHWMAMLAPIALGGILLAGLAIGLMLTPLGLLYKDIQKGMDIAVRLLFFFTPVAYAAPQSGVLGQVMYYNPITPLLTTIRTWVMPHGNFASAASPSLVVLAGSVLLLLGSWLIYRVSRAYLTERLG